MITDCRALAAVDLPKAAVDSSICWGAGPVGHLETFRKIGDCRSTQLSSCGMLNQEASPPAARIPPSCAHKLRSTYGCGLRYGCGLCNFSGGSSWISVASTCDTPGKCEAQQVLRIAGFVRLRPLVANPQGLRCHTEETCPILLGPALGPRVMSFYSCKSDRFASNMGFSSVLLPCWWRLEKKTSPR